MNESNLWQIKMAARIHDPAEKALVLLRDPAGHEGGSIVEIGRQLGFATRKVSRPGGLEYDKLKLDPKIDKIVRQADRWAAAADRAQFPKDRNDRYVQWAQVRFGEEGELRHPLSGERFEIHRIGQQVLAETIRDESARAFTSLIQRCENGEADHKLTTMAFWRFGPELGKRIQGLTAASDNQPETDGPLASLGHLWGLLPADTRTPDHSIWQHLDLTSALAGAMSGQSRPALLTVSIGPVQDFIAAGRSTSDLWAGSHFLAMAAWRAMQVVAKKFGPDAILFPQLRGVPVVDLWLIEQGLDPALFASADWHDTSTDYNPLFAAALPNRFVAIVPQDEAEAIAERISRELGIWVGQQARKMLDQLLEAIGEKPDGQHCYRQLKEQLAGFPEVHWSVAPWSAADELEAALEPFYPDDGQRPGMFGSQARELLTEAIEPEKDWAFWQPNDGTLYPAVYDLGDRTLAAAKSVRAFEQHEQHGYRDSLAGEHEWLTLDRAQLEEGSPRQRTDTLWARAAAKNPRWSKRANADGRGAEHLSVFGLIKRLWPDHYVKLIKDSNWYKRLPKAEKPDLDRYVVSTHVMALAPTMEGLIEHGPSESERAGKAWAALAQNVDAVRASRPALPRRLMSARRRKSEHWEMATRLPDLIERVGDSAGPEEADNDVERTLADIEKAAGRPVERYYAMVLMDGDSLGAWLAGKNTLKGSETFHSKVRRGLEGYDDRRLKNYLDTRRLVSVARHMAISTALSGFSLDLVRHVVEDECLGKVLYAGGDDVMAMVSVRDLLKAMMLLRAAYSGGLPEKSAMDIKPNAMKLENGFVSWQDRLYMMMGARATASAGAVVAHHQAPLAAVMRELRRAERRAKNQGGRDAFAITIVKRSGGALYLTAKWGKTMDALGDTIEFLRQPGVSRRAVYHTQLWLKDLPPASEHADMLATLLAYQLARQAEKARDEIKARAPALGRQLADLAAGQRNDGLHWLENFLSVAEFLAREIRGGPLVNKGPGSDQPSARETG